MSNTNPIVAANLHIDLGSSINTDSKLVPDLKDKKILIVEDEVSISKVMKLKLTAAGFITQTSNNGKEALELIRKENFDLVLLDLVMPEMNGFEVLEALKSDNNKVKVIITSNLSQNDDVAKATELGAIDFFIKSSIPINTIVKKVTALLLD